MWDSDFHWNVGNRPSLGRLVELGPKYIFKIDPKRAYQGALGNQKSRPGPPNKSQGVILFRTALDFTWWVVQGALDAPFIGSTALGPPNHDIDNIA